MIFYISYYLWEAQEFLRDMLMSTLPIIWYRQKKRYKKNDQLNKMVNTSSIIYLKYKWNAQVT